MRYHTPFARLMISKELGLRVWRLNFVFCLFLLTYFRQTVRRRVSSLVPTVCRLSSRGLPTADCTSSLETLRTSRNGTTFSPSPTETYSKFRTSLCLCFAVNLSLKIRNILLYTTVYTHRLHPLQLQPSLDFKAVFGPHHTVKKRD